MSESSSGSTFEAFRDWYQALPDTAQDIPVFTIVFGDANSEEMKSLAELTGGRVFDSTSSGLSAVFKEMGGGDYWITLVPVAGNGKAGRPLHLSYKRGVPALVPSGGISPALYNVISVYQNGSPLGTEAWALVCSPSTYASAASEFGQLAAASETWPEEMDPSATRAILRAKLDDLAGSRADQK